MAVTTIILNVKSVTANDDTVSATDSTRSKSRTIRSSETVTSTNDVNDVNDEGASESSDKTNVTLNDPTKNDSILTALSVSVECDSTPKPDIILFMVVDSYNSQCVCALVPFAESRHVEVDGELSSLTVDAYGLQRRNYYGNEWHAVLSHSHLDTTNTSSQKVTEYLPNNGALTVKLPNLSFRNIGNPFPFSAEKSLPAKISQDEWIEDKYTLSCPHKTNKIIFLRRMKDGRLTILVHKSDVIDVTFPFPLRPASDFDVHIMEIVQESGNVFKSNTPSEKLYFRTRADFHVMAQNTHWQRQGTRMNKKISRLFLRRHVGNGNFPLRIDIVCALGPPPDFLFLQVSNSMSHFIFNAFVRQSYCLTLTCPGDVLRISLATVTVYGVNKCKSHTGEWCDILMGGKATVQITGGISNDYIMVTMQPLTSYLDLLTDTPNKVPYDVDIDNIGPRQYVLTDLHHRNRITNTFIIFLYQIHPPAACIMFHHGSGTQYEIPFYLKPATLHKLQLFRVQTRHVIDDMYMFIGDSRSTVTSFTTYMTQNEVSELLTKAIHFVSKRPSRFLDISHFYRNKSEEYFNNVRKDGVMCKYDKNWGGDQASALNKQIKGLFFSTTVDPRTLLPPHVSFFGPIRLHVPTYFLLNNNVNMYFSDFYCHRVNHKVQLVLAVKGSPTDHFCRQRLVLMNQANNAFLVRERYGFTEVVRVTMNVTVEIFYTEDVPVNAMLRCENVYFTIVKQKGNALTMVNGIPKNKNCRICNLDSFIQAQNIMS